MSSSRTLAELRRRIHAVAADSGMDGMARDILLTGLRRQYRQAEAEHEERSALRYGNVLLSKLTPTRRTPRTTRAGELAMIHKAAPEDSAGDAILRLSWGRVPRPMIRRILGDRPEDLARVLRALDRSA